MRHFPPALTILALAVSVNLRAATVSLGTSRSLISSVTVPTTTAMRSLPIFVNSLLLSLLLLTEVLNEAGQGEGWSVDLGRDESSYHSLSES